MNDEAMVLRARANPARRLKILEAAGRLFAQVGVRGASMEAIAAEAGVAKGTLYAYFPDKDAVFVGAAEVFAERMVAAVEDALRRAASVDARVAAGLVARHRMVFAQVDGTGFVTDIMATLERLARPLFNETDARVMSALERTLAEDATLAPSAGAIARLLFQAAVGIGRGAKSEAQLESSLTSFVRTYLIGARVVRLRSAKARSQVPGGETQ